MDDKRKTSPWKILHPDGKQIVILPGSDDFDKFSRQFPEAVSALKSRFVPVTALIPGWSLSDKLQNCLIEIISVLPRGKLGVTESVRNETDWNVVKSKAEELAGYILRIRVFLGNERADVKRVHGISDENPTEPFLETEFLNSHPYRRKSIKGLVDVKPSEWADAAKLLARAEVLLSRRKLKSGRPPGTGWFSTYSEFEIALKEVLAKCSKRPTQLELMVKLDAHPLCRRPPDRRRTQNDTKLLRNWIDNAGLTDFDTALKKYFKPRRSGK